MTTEEFRAALLRLDLSQGEVSRLLNRLGDTATPHTVRRRVERMAQGLATVSGELAALITVFEQFPTVLEALREPRTRRRPGPAPKPPVRACAPAAGAVHG